VEQGSIVIVLNAAALATLLTILFKAFTVARTVGKYEADFASHKVFTEREITQLRQTVHKLSNEVHRLSGRMEVEEYRSHKDED
jgi:hypothetical protein